MHPGDRFRSLKTVVYVFANKAPLGQLAPQMLSSLADVHLPSPALIRRPPGLQVSSHQPRVCRFKSNISLSCLILSAYCYISSQPALLRPINQATRQTGAFNELIKVWIGAVLVSLRFLLKGRKICSSSPCQEGSVGNHPTLLFPSELQQYGINQGFHTSCSHGEYINHR